jgi:regulator of sigma E protease
MQGVVSNILSWMTSGFPAFLFVITVVVFFHELGHFAIARFFNVTVQAFSIGFGRELIGWTDRKGTRWKISLLPFGGYVRFAGDADAASRPDNAYLQKVGEGGREGILHFKPVYQRAAVAVAGPLANFILAIVIFTGVFMLQPQPVEPPIISEITMGSAAEASGLRVGDTILTVDGESIEHYSDLQRIVTASKGNEIAINILRDGQPMTVMATPRNTEITDELTGAKRTAMLLGIKDRFETMSFPAAAVQAMRTTGEMISQTLGYFGRLIVGRASTNELSGPLGIAKASGDFAAAGFMALLKLTALISVAIGFANLLPIPLLDGGHLLYCGFEAVLGRPLGERAQEVGFRLGLAFVLCLMLLATFNDLVRFNLF